MENLINSIVDDSATLITGALQQAIAFYDDFLRQEQYREETPQQLQTQKIWIDKQPLELTQENTAVSYR